MLFLIDAQLPPALAGLITRLGHEAEHTFECDLPDETDNSIWFYSVANKSIIITKDADFAIRRAASTSGPQVIWIRLPNTRRSALLDWFEAMFPAMIAALERGETLVEIT
jgi:predicted nuclease of predicted toxin-antitoxin system